MNLYELTENYLNLQELIDNPEVPQGMINKALDEVGEAIEEKAENIAKLIKTNEVYINGFKEEEKRIAEKRKAMEAKNKGLKTYLENCMREVNKLKFKGKLFSFNIQNNAPSVKYVDETKIPKDYYVEQDPVLDRKALLEALKAGKEIEGVELQQTSSLRIR
ncbi:siphovirus Gp157 family protein [Hathewaya massiliensis]|uniref:siphovirus Gp157 family protein n=1 Tax=Hathewaya massiliensis TaxID=1964382 RepID=UPI00115A1C47|nr:siphovirus Gp157 family protein [Hathewaya massiliensis]